MSVDGLTDAEIADILQGTERVAVVGASANPGRPSNMVTRMLIDHGYEVTPVNPGLAGQSIHGRMVVGSLAEAGKLDMVDVFRASESVGPVVNEAVRLGARSVWMQLGVINEAAAAVGRAAGLRVVMDRCPAIEVPRLGVGKKVGSVD